MDQRGTGHAKQQSTDILNNISDNKFDTTLDNTGTQTGYSPDMTGQADPQGAAAAITLQLLTPD